MMLIVWQVGSWV